MADSLETALSELEERFRRRATEVMVGRNRIVFVMHGYVVKLPFNGQGFADNDWEGSVSNTPETVGDMDYIQYPHTRLIYFKDIPVLFMEYVKHLGWSGTESLLGYEPAWIGSVDCGQIGINKHGRIVAYDYGRY